MRLTESLYIVSAVFGGLWVARTEAAVDCIGQLSPPLECKCTGAPIGKEFVGGDGKPINWHFQPYAVSPPTSTQIGLNCYFKMVENMCSEPIYNVYWDVAKFYRRYIPDKRSAASCPQFPGPVSDTPTNGRLQYGAGSDGYDTTVLTPKAGWGDTASADQRGSGSEDSTTQTELAFFIETEGVPVPVRLILQSRAFVHDGIPSITYSVINDSDARLAVLVNLSATEKIIDQVPFIQQQFSMKAKMKEDFTVAVGERATIEAAAIVVRNIQERIVAFDSGAFYTIKGVKATSDRSIWKSIK